MALPLILLNQASAGNRVSYRPGSAPRHGAPYPVSGGIESCVRHLFPGAPFAGVAAAGVLPHSFGTPMMEQMNYNLLFRWFVGLDMGMLPSGCPRSSPRTGIDSWITVPFGYFSTRCWNRPGPGLAFGRAFFGGWHAAGGLSVPEVLSAQGSERPGRRRIGLSGTEA